LGRASQAASSAAGTPEVVAKGLQRLAVAGEAARTLMDPDVMITIAFGFEVFLFALVAAFYVAHEARKAHAGAEAVARATDQLNRRSPRDPPS
jgi:hypothetical protein